MQELSNNINSFKRYVTPDNTDTIRSTMYHLPRMKKTALSKINRIAKFVSEMISRPFTKKKAEWCNNKTIINKLEDFTNNITIVFDDTLGKDNNGLMKYSDMNLNQLKTEKEKLEQCDKTLKNITSFIRDNKGHFKSEDKIVLITIEDKISKVDTRSKEVLEHIDKIINNQRFEKRKIIKVKLRRSRFQSKETFEKQKQKQVNSILNDCGERIKNLQNILDSQKLNPSQSHSLEDVNAIINEADNISDQLEVLNSVSFKDTKIFDKFKTLKSDLENLKKIYTQQHEFITELRATNVGLLKIQKKIPKIGESIVKIDSLSAYEEVRRKIEILEGQFQKHTNYFIISQPLYGPTQNLLKEVRTSLEDSDFFQEYTKKFIADIHEKKQRLQNLYLDKSPEVVLKQKRNNLKATERLKNDLEIFIKKNNLTKQMVMLGVAELERELNQEVLEAREIEAESSKNEAQEFFENIDNILMECQKAINKHRDLHYLVYHSPFGQTAVSLASGTFNSKYNYLKNSVEKFSSFEVDETIPEEARNKYKKHKYQIRNMQNSLLLQIKYVDSYKSDLDRRPQWYY